MDGDKAKLCHIYTNSFILHIKIEIKVKGHDVKRFDTSNHESGQPLRICISKNVFIMMKDELSDEI